MANQIYYIVIGVSLLGMTMHAAFRRKQEKDLDPKLAFLFWGVYFYFILDILAYVGTERYIIPVMPVHSKSGPMWMAL